MTGFREIPEEVISVAITENNVVAGLRINGFLCGRIEADCHKDVRHINTTKAGTSERSCMLLSIDERIFLGTYRGLFEVKFCDETITVEKSCDYGDTF